MRGGYLSVVGFTIDNIDDSNVCAMSVMLERTDISGIETRSVIRPLISMHLTEIIILLFRLRIIDFLIIYFFTRSIIDVSDADSTAIKIY